jgi:pimeloyl-ACP methyl ester carboxylesterase
MRVIGGLWTRARELGRAIGDGVVDSGHAALYLRQLLRGNRGAPSIRRSGLANVRAGAHAIPRPDAGGPRPAPPVRSHQSAPSGPSDPPVLLLHGYLATRGSVHLLEQRLTQLGHVVMTYRLGPVQMGDIRQSSGFIAGKVDSLRAQTGVDKVDIVAHSMGGLVALDYLKRRDGAAHVRRLILLGTPVQGTWSALMGLMTVPLGQATVQLLPRSAFLRELAALPIPPGPEVVTIAAERDWLAPSRTTVLPGARHVSIATGHSGLLVDDQVARQVSRLLRGAPDDADRPVDAVPQFDASRDTI